MRGTVIATQCVLYKAVQYTHTQTHTRYSHANGYWYTISGLKCFSKIENRKSIDSNQQHPMQYWFHLCYIDMKRNKLYAACI